MTLLNIRRIKDIRALETLCWLRIRVIEMVACKVFNVDAAARCAVHDTRHSDVTELYVMWHILTPIWMARTFQLKLDLNTWLELCLNYILTPDWLLNITCWMSNDCWTMTFHNKNLKIRANVLAKGKGRWKDIDVKNNSTQIILKVFKPVKSTTSIPTSIQRVNSAS